MGVQINGNTDTISATDGSLVVSGAELPAVININATGIITATSFVGDGSALTGLASDAITEGNTSAEVVDTGSDGHFKVTTEGTERLRVDSSGRLGIGITSPVQKLEVSDTSTVRLTVRNTTENTSYQSSIDFATGTGSLSSSNVVGRIVSLATAADPNPLAGALTFNTNGGDSLQERARIDSSGRLLVGTSTAYDDYYKTTAQYTSGLYVARNQWNSVASFSNWQNANSEPTQLMISRAKSGVIGTHGALSSGDGIGALVFNASDGTNFRTSALIEAVIDGGVSAGDVPGRLVFSTTADGSSSPTERMRIGQNGFFKASNLGSYNDTNGNYHEFRASVNSFQILRVEHTSNVSGNGTYSSVLGSNCNNTSSYHFVANANGDRLFIYGNGNVVNSNNSYGSLSDLKLKENIVDANSQWDDLKALQVRNYNFKEGQTHTQIGLIAQEVELVSPGLVTESPDRDEEGNDLGTVTKSVNYSVLYMKAVKALQEAMERIETLEAEVAALKNP